MLVVVDVFQFGLRRFLAVNEKARGGGEGMKTSVFSMAYDDFK